jgi:hypothetical protein
MGGEERRRSAAEFRSKWGGARGWRILHRAGPAVRIEQFHGGGQDVEHEDPMHFDGAEQQSMRHGGRTTVK